MKYSRSFLKWLLIPAVIVTSFSILVSKSQDADDWESYGKEWKEFARKMAEKWSSSSSSYHCSNRSNGYDSVATKEDKKVLGLKEIRNLAVSNRGGQVVVRGGSKENSVVFCFRLRDKTIAVAQKKLATVRPVSEEKDASVLIEAPEVERLETDIVIQLKSPSVNVKIRNVAGPVEIENIKGNLDLNAYAGSVEIKNASLEECLIDSSSGGVEMDNVSIERNLDLNVYAGSANIRNTTIKDGSINVSSGSLRLALASPFSGNLKAMTRACKITAFISKESDCKVRLKTRGGSAKSYLELKNKRSHSVGAIHKITGELGNGKGLLDLEASAGSIILRGN